MPTTTSPIKTVGVIGTGVIGASWIALFLSRGLFVIVSDPAPGAKARLDAFLQKHWSAVEAQGLAGSAAPSSYEFVDDVADHLDKVDFVQENGPENVAIKRAIFAKLDARARADIVIASSSSGIPSSQFITDCTHMPSRVLIGHPFNPPHLIPLVEVVPHASTSPAAVERAMDFYRSLGKRPIHVRAETPGFVANRLQVAVCSEAYSLVQRGVVSPADLDAAMTTGLGLRWALTGPLMTNALGGGGGMDGFRHLLEHIGPGMAAWEADMREHQFGWSKEDLGAVSGEVGKWMEKLDADEVQKERDEVLLALLKLKKKAASLV
ncbi:uncharacterized protein K452DRAFT_303503 [Aplosporella prunicola CBS 121167]|uniref:3-hydroxyacyl-CoA dehydrogenase NAD binding domain-containing protein n=1 Tax=Aplosporella prunicola CBS 121167 TaxID=1176127 RepID=A0A6A6AWZ7_9PEZI|nr:uncharacterized protein K452DRAFT_303503 [Aplosporella prunicola CBS 121167]KAF2135505.1 hypothetical protein K452DRAFT_303503 [Aplosporella prunicola CBS 121167]